MTDAVFWDTWERLRAHDWLAVSNGKAYYVTGLSRGAGDLRDHVLVTYRCRESGETFVRDLAEWADRMAPAPETPPLWTRRAPTTEALLPGASRPCFGARRLSAESLSRAVACLSLAAARFGYAPHRLVLSPTLSATFERRLQLPAPAAKEPAE